MARYITQVELIRLINSALNLKNFSEPYWTCEMHIELGTKEERTPWINYNAYNQAVERDRMSDRMYSANISPDDFIEYDVKIIPIEIIHQHFTLNLNLLLTQHEYHPSLLPRNFFVENKWFSKINSDTVTVEASYQINVLSCINLLEKLEDDEVKTFLVNEIINFPSRGGYSIRLDAFEMCLKKLPFTEEQLKSIFLKFNDPEHIKIFKDNHPVIVERVQKDRDTESITALLKRKDSYLSGRTRGQPYVPKKNLLWNKEAESALNRLLDRCHETEESFRQSRRPS